MLEYMHSVEPCIDELLFSKHVDNEMWVVGLHSIQHVSKCAQVGCSLDIGIIKTPMKKVREDLKVDYGLCLGV
jgi:hypothetical protein